MSELNRLIYQLRKQYPIDGQHTYSDCPNSCGGVARGGDECPNCLESKIAALSTKSQARELHKTYRAAAMAERNVLKAAEMREAV